MNSIDIAIIIFLLWGAINGFIKGFVVQILTLVALVLGVWIASAFYETIGTYLSKAFSLSTKITNIASFTLIYIGVLVGMHFLSKLLTSLLGKSVFGQLNRIGGVIFGMTKMAFIASVFIFIIQKIDTKQKLLTPEVINESKLFNPIARIAPAIFPHLHLEEVKKALYN